jgi:hypothetical protein
MRLAKLFKNGIPIDLESTQNISESDEPKYLYSRTYQEAMDVDAPPKTSRRPRKRKVTPAGTHQSPIYYDSSTDSDDHTESGLVSESSSIGAGPEEQDRKPALEIKGSIPRERESEVGAGPSGGGEGQGEESQHRRTIWVPVTIDGQPPDASPYHARSSSTPTSLDRQPTSSTATPAIVDSSRPIISSASWPSSLSPAEGQDTQSQISTPAGSSAPSTSPILPPAVPSASPEKTAPSPSTHLAPSSEPGSSSIHGEDAAGPQSAPSQAKHQASLVRDVLLSMSSGTVEAENLQGSNGLTVCDTVATLETATYASSAYNDNLAAKAAPTTNKKFEQNM